MKNLRIKQAFLMAFCVLLLPAMLAADWTPDDPAKWLQAPKPGGFDVEFAGSTLADDFECTEQGLVASIHFWVSWMNAMEPEMMGKIQTVTVTIYSDIPDPDPQDPTTFSTPGDILWGPRIFDDAQFVIRTMEPDLQPWFDPSSNEWGPNDHTQWQQINIMNIPEPFEQKGTPDVPLVYWLAVEIQYEHGAIITSPGWKESVKNWNDNAVWWDIVGQKWIPLRNPDPQYENAPIDLAFVLQDEFIEEEIDFGDAPEFWPDGTATGYPTTVATGNNGARHIITAGGPFFDDGTGTDNPDAEPDGQPTTPADGDDNDGNDDEDGVIVPVLVVGQNATISFFVGGPGGGVEAFIDWNADGDWADAGEALPPASYPPGPSTMTVTVPASAVVGPTYARFRISTTSVVPMGYAGQAPDGEVEDCLVKIRDPEPQDFDYGDAPESDVNNTAIAYPSLGVLGHFPTCKTMGSATSFIQHNNGAQQTIAWFGPMRDLEPDGNAGLCPAGFPLYDQDECFQDGDAGLLIPDAYTIDTAGSVIPCPAGAGMPLGMTCNMANWGSDIDIEVHNHMPNGTVGYVNVLIDWNQNGNWSGSSNCPTGLAPEHVLVDFPIPNPFDGPLSALTPPGFIIGPNAGFAWARFSITEKPVYAPGAMWEGFGIFEDGETEDYLLLIDQGEEPPERLKFRQLPLDGAVVRDMRYFGHDEVSTVYPYYGDPGPVPMIERYLGCYMADDFADYAHSPVIRVKWWGSYLGGQVAEEQPQPVNSFVIAFETDNPGPPSHPEVVLQHEEVMRDMDGILTPGEFTENWVSPGGPPCHESLYEYEAVLQNPFPQDPNVVYWLKIVAVVDLPPDHTFFNDPRTNPDQICDFLNNSYDPQFYDVTRWGWHNRDYTQMDPFASTQVPFPPQGEHIQGFIPDPTAPNGEIEVWHFQDDSVTGALQLWVDDNDPGAWRKIVEVDQHPDFWEEQYYKFMLPYCTGPQGVDGPPEIDQFSKDLAFELWTKRDCRLMLTPAEQADYDAYMLAGADPTCWCWRYQCHGDADNAEETVFLEGDYRIYDNDLTLLINNWKGTVASGANPCADFDHASEYVFIEGTYNIYDGDLTRLINNWKAMDSSLPDCPTYLP